MCGGCMAKVIKNPRGGYSVIGSSSILKSFKLKSKAQSFSDSVNKKRRESMKRVIEKIRLGSKR